MYSKSSLLNIKKLYHGQLLIMKYYRYAFEEAFIEFEKILHIDFILTMKFLGNQKWLEIY